MLGERVVDPLLSLLDAWLAGGVLEHVGDEVLHVLVRQGFLRRHDVVAILGLPEEVVHTTEATAMPPLSGGTSS